MLCLSPRATRQSARAQSLPRCTAALTSGPPLLSSLPAPSLPRRLQYQDPISRTPAFWALTECASSSQLPFYTSVVLPRILHAEPDLAPARSPYAAHPAVALSVSMTPGATPHCRGSQGVEPRKNLPLHLRQQISARNQGAQQQGGSEIHGPRDDT